MSIAQFANHHDFRLDGILVDWSWWWWVEWRWGVSE